MGIIKTIEYPFGKEDRALVRVEVAKDNMVDFIMDSKTYFIDQYQMKIGDLISVYYNQNAPAILIYPPRFPALVVNKVKYDEQLKIDFFDQNGVSSDQMLKIVLTPNSNIIWRDGQKFYGDLANRYLIVRYTSSTKSIPAQTIPHEIIVLA